MRILKRYEVVKFYFTSLIKKFARSSSIYVGGFGGGTKPFVGCSKIYGGGFLIFAGGFSSAVHNDKNRNRDTNKKDFKGRSIKDMTFFIYIYLLLGFLNNLIFSRIVAQLLLKDGGYYIKIFLPAQQPSIPWGGVRRVIFNIGFLFIFQSIKKIGFLINDYLLLA